MGELPLELQGFESALGDRATLDTAIRNLAEYLRVVGAGDPRSQAARSPVENDYIAFLSRRLGFLEQQAAALDGGTMGFLDTLNNIGQTIGSVIGGVATTVGQVIGSVGQAAGALNTVLNGGTSGAMMPMGMPVMQAPASSMVNGNTSVSGQMAFETACRADPACTAAIVAALQGGQMAPMMNGSLPMNEDAMLAALGFPPALIMQLRMIPGAIGKILGSPAGQIAIGVGGGLVGTALGASALGGMSTGMRLPRRIQVPDGKGGVREYVSRGRPVLYSGDLSAVRRVRKVAQRVPRPRRARQRPLMITAGAGVANVCGKCLTAPCGCNGR